MPTQTADCQQLRASLEEIHSLKGLFDSAFAEANRTGNTAEAQRLRKELETKLAALQERLNPFETELAVREQYEFQVKLLKETGLVQQLSSGEFGIVGMDTKEYPLPTLSEVNRRMMEKRAVLQEKIPQGFTKLLLVPFGLNVQQCVEAYKKVILKHHQEGKLFATKREPSDPDEPLALDTNEPVWKWDKITQAALVYYPETYDPNPATHKGKTKEQLLSQGHGFHILLSEELPNIPRKDNGITRGGRPQLTTEIDPTKSDAYTTQMKRIIERQQTTPSPQEYLKFFQANTGAYQHEQVFTIEDQLLLAITHLEQTNQVMDDWQGKGSASYQLGSYLPTESAVVAARWYRDYQRAYVYRGGVYGRYDDGGVRSSVSL